MIEGRYYLIAQNFLDMIQFDQTNLSGEMGHRFCLNRGSNLEPYPGQLDGDNFERPRIGLGELDQLRTEVDGDMRGLNPAVGKRRVWMVMKAYSGLSEIYYCYGIPCSDLSVIRLKSKMGVYNGRFKQFLRKRFMKLIPG